jgi:threonine synthase
VLSKLEQGGMTFSSANSINWGRLVPQIVYYVSSYVSLAESGEIAYGDKLNVVVPTGNFGNILAAYYAKQMGVPIGKLICASNINKVLTDFIRTGVYDRNRDFFATTSPSMDILISSNLERLLYLLTEEDDAQIRQWFTALSETGRYEVTDAVKAKLSDLFYGGFCDDSETKATIAEIYKKYGYTCDTHTAVAVKVYEDYRRETGDTTKTIIASTASPFKFSASVLEALEKKPADGTDEYDMVQILSDASSLEIPASLAALKTKPRRFEGSIEKTQMCKFVLSELYLS